MLSILIPTYNYNVLPLVKETARQCQNEGIPFEILVFDDASPKPAPENDQIHQIPNARFEKLPENIGRSAIRNKLADSATYDWLLFLDSDTIPVSSDFISSYLSEIKNGPAAINGGIRYQIDKPSPDRLFRWTYGKLREALNVNDRRKNPYLSFLSLNFLIPKALFQPVRFNEEMPNMRHEDTVFSYSLRQKGIPVRHIENPVFHLGLDPFETAIRKERESLIALKELLDSKILPPDYLKMAKLFTLVRKSGLRKPIASAFTRIEKPLIRQLSGKNPSMRLFDLYRIGYLCTL